MRVVVDTNVFVSAILKKASVPALVHREDTLLKSKATEDEVRLVLARPRFSGYVGPSLPGWLNQALDAAEEVIIAERMVACRDPKDDKFLELAVNGHVDLVVSGDADLLALKMFRDIPIISPAAFVSARRS